MKLARTIYYAMMYSKIKYAISVYGLSSLENINKIQVLQNKLPKVLAFKNYRYSTNPAHTHCLAHAPPSVHGYFNTNGFNFSGSVQHVFWCSYDMLGFLTFDRDSVISYKAITKFLVFLEEKKFHNITTISLS